MISFKDFTEYIDYTRQISQRDDKLRALGIDLMDWSELHNHKNKALLRGVFNSVQLDIFEWWLYDAEGLEGDVTEAKAWDNEGNPIDLSDERKIYDHLMSYATTTEEGKGG